MNLKSERVQRAGAWLDKIISPSIQRTIATTVILGFLVRMGFNVNDLGLKVEGVSAKADRNAELVTDIRTAIREDSDAAFLARSKTWQNNWQITNQLARIEQKQDAILEKLAKTR